MARTSWFSRSVWGFVLASLLTGCGGGNGGSTGSSPAGPQPDFSINVPSSVTVTPNSTQTISISATAENAFSSSVAVSLSGLPTGVTAAPASFNLTPVASSQNVRGNTAHSSGAPGPSQTIVITADKSVAPGPIPVTVTATSGSITHTDTTSTNLPDFALAGPASTIALTAGATAQITVSADAFNGFSGPVAASLAGLPAGVSASLSNLTLTPGTPQTITLTAAANVASGSATLTLQGTSGTLSHNLEFPLALGAPIATPDFTLSATPGNLTLQAGGGSQSLTVLATAVNGFTGSITADLTGLPAGITASPATIALLPGTAQIITLSAAASSAIGTATLTIQGTSASITHSAPVMLTITAPPPDFSLTVAPATVGLQAGGSVQSFTVSATGLHGFMSPIAVALTGLPNGLAAMPGTFMLTPGTPQQISLNASSTAAAGNTNLIVSATSGSLAHSATVTVTVQPPSPDFSLSLSPASISLPIGGAAQQVNITANAVGAFSSPVNLSITGLPTGVTASPASLTLTPGGAQTISFQASGSATAGSATVTLQGVSGTLTHSATFSLIVAAPAPDFQLFAGPSTFNLSTIADGELTIALIPMNGFNAAATVTVSGLPTGVSLENPPLPLVANIPQRLWLNAANGPGTATAGQTPITITATSGTVTHTAQVNLVITTPTLDFGPTLFAGSNPGNATPIPGLLLTPGTYTFSIMLSSAGGSDSGTTVQLSGLVPGTGLDQTQYTFSGNPTDQAVFNITVTPSAVGERGVLTAAFTGAQINHEVDLPIYVVAQPSIFSYIPPLSLQQGGATDLPYEVASTSPNRIYLYLGSDWPQNFWLNPYPVNPGDLLVAGSTGVESGQYSLSVDANSASGPTSLSLQFIEGSLSQVVPVAVQVNSFSDFNVNLEPSTIALEAGATQPLTVSATGLGAFSGPIQFSLDNLPAGVQASPQSFTLAAGSSQPVTLTAGSSYSAGGTLSVDSTSGSINHATPVAVSPGSATTTLVATGTTFSGLGVMQIFNSGTYNSVVSIAPYPNSTYPNVMQALLAYVPRSQLGSYTSNCNGNTSNSACTPVNIGIYPQAAFESPVLDQPGTITLNANVPGVPSAVLQFDQILPDFTLSFSPSTLTIPAGGGATLTVTPTAISPTFTSYCGTAFVANLYGSKVFNATFTAPPGGLNVSSSPLNLCGSNPLTTSVSVPAGTPPGDYEISVNAQLDTGYQPYYSSQAQYNPIATIAAAHTFGVGVTVTPAAAPPAPSFQLAASPVDISIAAGQSFPVTVSATGGNGFTGSISVSAANLPSGVTVSPSSFTLNAGSSQPITVSVAPGTAAASGQITLSGTSGSITGSTQISITVQ
jgi:hypothetical protein